MNQSNSPNNFMDHIMGTAMGMVGAVTGMGCLGLVIVAGLVTVLCILPLTACLMISGIGIVGVAVGLPTPTP